MIDLEDYSQKALIASASKPIWIRDNAELERRCADWKACSVIALDTEFIRTDTFYPIPGLIQLADHQCCYLLDPLAIDRWEPFRTLLIDEKVIKVFHAPGEDLELFSHSYGVLPRPLLDTQMAAAFAGRGFGLGLARLVKQVLDVELEKGETRSDWLQRPLTAEQEHYAALDVAYLPSIALTLLTELEQLDRLSWVEEETRLMLQAYIDIEESWRSLYLKFPQCARYGAPRLAALRDLFVWREQIIRQLNIPRTRFLTNKMVIEIIDRKVSSLSDLSKIKGIRGYVLGQYGAQILNLIRSGKQSAEDDPPEPVPRPLSTRWHKAAKALYCEAEGMAESLNIPIELLARRRDIEGLIRYFDQSDDQLPTWFQGWRSDRVAAPLLQKLHQLRSEAQC